MIKITELRIGNWIEWPNFKGDGVTAMFVVDADIMKTFLNLDRTRLEHMPIRGIELCTVFLEKCGFMEQPLYSEWFQLEKDYWTMRYAPRVKCFYLGDTFVAHIRYLHELQNLHHSLTGKELEVGLKQTEYSQVD